MYTLLLAVYTKIMGFNKDVKNDWLWYNCHFALTRRALWDKKNVGILCNAAQAPLTDESSEDVPFLVIIIICVVGALILALNIILIVFFVRRRRKEYDRGISSLLQSIIFLLMLSMLKFYCRSMSCDRVTRLSSLSTGLLKKSRMDFFQNYIMRLLMTQRGFV